MNFNFNEFKHLIDNSTSTDKPFNRTQRYPNANDKNKMKPAFEQMLSCIRQHSLTYNEAKAVFRALENAMPAIMVIPKNS